MKLKYPMIGGELYGLIDLLGLTQTDAARLLGVNDRTVRRWISGEQEIPRAVAIAIQMMAYRGEKAADWMPAQPVQDA